MNTLWFLFSSSFVIGLSGAMMPGPVLTATIGEVMKRGFIAGPLIVLGHGLLEGTLLIGLVLGLGDWLVLPVTRMMLGYAGGALLLLMGVHMIWTARAAAEQATAAVQGNDLPSPLHGPVLAGALTTMSNPYFYVWWATIGLGYAALSLERGIAGLTAFYSGHILSDLVWYSVVAAGVATGRRVCPPLLYRLVLSGCGMALMALGLFFIRFGMRQLG